MNNVIQLKPNKLDDIMYMTEGGKPIGVTGKSVYMEVLPDKTFLFNDSPVSYNELLAFILLTQIPYEIEEIALKNDK